MSDASNDDRGEISAAERDAFRRRLAELDDKIDQARDPVASGQRGGSGARNRATTGKGMAVGFQMASEFVAAIVVGGLIGFALDWAIGWTRPWLLILFVLLGFAAGVMNLMRSYRRLQGDIDRETGGRIGQDLPPDADDDEK